jgi:hypothetical protein
MCNLKEKINMNIEYKEIKEFTAKDEHCGFETGEGKVPIFITSLWT